MSDIEKLLEWVGPASVDNRFFTLVGIDSLTEARKLAVGALADTEALLEFIDYEGAMGKYIWWCSQGTR